jgi:hypothetical protein
MLLSHSWEDDSEDNDGHVDDRDAQRKRTGMRLT